ncbi:MAG: lipid-A-disaccharide synthase [Acidobacteriota bacterium]|nr:lipid-A-disaccharide synthase [Acidobacteriota bacterium]
MDSVLIVAGEASGEKYGAALVREFRKLDPLCRFFGIGGKGMAGEGVEILCPAENLAVVGLAEILTQIPRIRKIFRRVLREAEARRPRAAVLIDSPDFNLRLAKKLRRIGLPVLYYVSPTVWAWRPGRLRTIARYVSRMMLIFPFEEEIYKKRAIPAVYVGHPLREMIRRNLGRGQFLAKYGLDPARRIVTLLPGSRRSEIERHMPILAETLPLISREIPVQWVLVLAEGLEREAVEKYLSEKHDDVLSLDRDGYEAMASADLVLSASGTANLETALLETPLIVFYRVSPLSYAMGRRLLKISRFSIVNILAGKEIVPELIQGGFTADNLSAEALRILRSPEAAQRMKEEFRGIDGLLGNLQASQNAAKELEIFVSRS